MTSDDTPYFEESEKTYYEPWRNATRGRHSNVAAIRRLRVGQLRIATTQYGFDELQRRPIQQLIKNRALVLNRAGLTGLHRAPEPPNEEVSETYYQPF